jgi:membrane associated rhomboid family serine protease
MIPLRDVNHTESVPVVTIVLIALNCAVWVYEVSLGNALGEFLFGHALVPLRFVHARHIAGGFMANAVIPLFSSIFMHAGWMHVIGNLWFLWIFGDNVEDRMGRLRYVFFYLACGLGASLAHVALNSDSRVPVVGASGAISGVLGAYLIWFPQARVHTLFIFFIIVRFIDVPAYLYLMFWFALQILGGASEIGRSANIGGTAYVAHLGGFAFGASLALLFHEGTARRGRSRRRIAP